MMLFTKDIKMAGLTSNVKKELFVTNKFNSWIVYCP